MKTYKEIKADLYKLEAHGLTIGDWVWLRPIGDQPRKKAQLRSPLAAVMLLVVEPEHPGDDGVRMITADKIEGPG